LYLHVGSQILKINQAFFARAVFKRLFVFLGFRGLAVIAAGLVVVVVAGLGGVGVAVGAAVVRISASNSGVKKSVIRNDSIKTTFY
jgi:tRNA A37 threonylcarbamoyladenosine dehydratase